MRIIDGAALAPWVGRMINIHPSLLPKYRGLHTHRRALDAGDREHGASVHFVTAELDGGPVIAQARLAIAARRRRGQRWRSACCRWNTACCPPCWPARQRTAALATTTPRISTASRCRRRWLWARKGLQLPERE